MDMYGAKVVLLASFIASAATYALTAAAYTMPLLYASSVPTLFQHAVLAVRVWVSSASSLEHRASMLGYIGLAYSVGQVTGPIVGGQVGDIAGPRAPAFLAMWGSMLSAVTVAAFLRGVSPSPHQQILLNSQCFHGPCRRQLCRCSPLIGTTHGCDVTLSQIFGVQAAPQGRTMKMTAPM